MTHLVRSLPGVIIPDAQDAIARQVFGPRRLRPFDPQAGSNITITPNALGVSIASTGGSGTPDDADLTLAQQAYQPHAPNLPTVRAGDASITVTLDALGYSVIANSAGAVDDANAIIAAREYRDRLMRLVTEIDLYLSDVTTGDVSTAKHGFVPKAPGSGDVYLNGNGSYSTPASSSVFDHVLATSYGLMLGG